MHQLDMLLGPPKNPSSSYINVGVRVRPLLETGMCGPLPLSPSPPS